MISYEELMAIFWNSHNPSQRSWGSQYKKALYYHNELQKEIAFATCDQIEAERGIKVRTEILPASTFYIAEDYHQKYYLQAHRAIVDEFTQVYPKWEDFVNSTAVARVNGYLSGYGAETDLQREIERYGLSAESQQALLSRAGRFAY